MDIKYTSRPHPSGTGSCITQTLLWWVGGLFRQGYRKGLEEVDIYDVLPEDSSIMLSTRLGKEWDKELYKWRTGGRPRLWMALLRCHGTSILAMGLLLLLQECLRLVQVYLIGELVSFFTGITTDVTLAYVYAASLSVSYILITVLAHPTFHTNYLLGMKMRVACTSLMYRKALHLSSHSVQNTSPENIIKLMAQDSQKLDQSLFAIHYVWLGPLSLAAVCVYLYYTFNSVTFLAAILVIAVLVLPVQVGMTKLFSVLRLKISLATNTRVKIIHEILRAVRSVKIYCWESTFCKQVQRLRMHELKKLRSLAFGRAFQLAYYFSYNKLVMLVLATALYLTNSNLNMKMICIALALFDILKISIVLMLPLGIFYGSQALNTIKKIQDFLLLEEKSHDVYSSCGIKLPEDLVVSFENFSAFPPATGDKISYAASLQTLTFSIHRGHLIVIVGPPGSGKTPLLMAMLGEIPRLRGFLRLQGKMSYASQAPWVFTASVRDNILFGQDYDRGRYNKVVKACDLNKDIESLPQSDMTIVGEHGFELFFGQKVKISLARTIYRHADVYLLDDPFGCVDSYVGRTIFNKCVCGLLKDSTVVLVTQQLPYVKVADKVLVMQEGNISSQGTYEELIASGVDFSAMLAEYEVERAPTIEASLASTAGLSKTKRRVCGSQQLSMESLNASLVSINLDGTETKSLHSLLISDKSGSRQSNPGTPWSVYGDYIAMAGGGGMVFAIVILWFITLGTYVFSDWLIIYWSNLWVDAASSSTTYYFLYIGISLCCILFSLLTGITFFHSMLAASKILHSDLFKVIVRAPLSDLQKDPVSEILKRFSQDVVQSDDLLPATTFDMLMTFGTIVGALVIACAGNFWMGILLIPLIAFFILIRYYYCHSARDIKLIESRSRFPVFNHLSTTLEGLWTIRALGSEDRFLHCFDILQDKHTAACYTYIASNRWFAIVLDIICMVFVTSLALISVVVSQHPVTMRGEIETVCLCLSLVYIVNLVWTFQTTVRNSIEVDHQMGAVDRVLKYSQLKSETYPGTTGASVDMPSTWPTYGIITFESVSLTYPDTGVRALRNIYCCFRAYEKVGVVGKAGAGKHSMVAAILRLYESKGVIRIDGVDTGSLSLKELREKIAVVPEDSPLFSGNLRQNLDINGKASDSDLWRILEEVNLKHKIESLPGRLYADMSHLQPHLSVGQKQLLCLARVLLKPNPKILIIEETMDNVDPRSAALLQKIVKRNFEHCTVITIARRLKTVIDADRIMVMDNGKIKELDPPHVLLQNEKGIFYNLVKQRGNQESALLREIARHKYENKPYVAPAMKEAEMASAVPARNPGYYIPAFQSSRLTAAFNHLLPNKEANKYQRKF
ncbi:ATP-binding cassette sub-family C member 4-like [Watersipora subatra]|uniref:ATP-binding cassette sub-family C member 4-like n=1 Tax=Watersipora subatra TaxID=2589382 RepID=UPI00355BC9F4